MIGELAEKAYGKRHYWYCRKPYIIAGLLLFCYSVEITWSELLNKDDFVKRSSSLMYRKNKVSV